MSKMLTTDEVCDVMCVSPQTLRHMVAAGEFPEPFRRGRPWTWAPQVIADVLAGNWQAAA